MASASRNNSTNANQTKLQQELVQVVLTLKELTDNFDIKFTRHTEIITNSKKKLSKQITQYYKNLYSGRIRNTKKSHSTYIENIEKYLDILK
jgi:phage-related minor tail protein